MRGMRIGINDYFIHILSQTRYKYINFVGDLKNFA